MTSLHREHSQHFFRENSQEEGLTAVPFVSSKKTTHDSGIQSIFNRFRSTITSLNRRVLMNGLNEEYSGEYSTIHITPEDGFSYASVEHSNVDLNANSAFSCQTLSRSANVFQPGKMTFAVTCHGGRETTNAFFSSLTSTNRICFAWEKRTRDRPCAFSSCRRTKALLRICVCQDCDRKFATIKDSTSAASSFWKPLTLVKLPTILAAKRQCAF